MNKNRPKVLVFVGYYIPGYKAGGPIKTISNMVNLMGDDISFSVVTRDRDLSDTTAYKNIESDSWVQVGNAEVRYVSARIFGFKEIIRIIREKEFDLIYLNSFFDPLFTFRVLVLRLFGFLQETPLVLAPRGEFSLGALKFKGKKKAFYIWFMRFSGALKGINWHATSEVEFNDILRTVGVDRQCISKAPNISSFPSNDSPLPARNYDNVLRVIFISRISPKKNLEYALKVVRDSGINIRFDIYGPIEDEKYWNRCKILIDTLPKDVVVDYKGSVESHFVFDLFKGYDVFLFPTFGENYGHVIGESLLAGTPVLTSDQTPWRNLFQKKWGWDLPLSQFDGFVDALRRTNEENYETRMAGRNARIEDVKRALTDSSIIQANYNVFEKVGMFSRKQ
jgi:glycosyltransferase involved in cell wall biosynthesis